MAERAAVLVLCLVLVAELAVAVVSDGLTYDEVAYIACGYRAFTTRDFRLNPEQPPVAKLLAAAPLLLLRPTTPDLRRGEGLWQWSQRFVLAENDPALVVPLARAPCALLTVVLAFLLWAWSRNVAGPVAGLFALALAVFHPSLLAHGHLATTDLPATAAMLATSWAFWGWWRAPTPGRAALVALLIGVGGATRVTTLLLVPAFLLVAVVAGRVPATRPRMASVLVLIGASAVIAPLVVWASYGFRFAPWPHATIARALSAPLGWSGRALATLHGRRLLPEAYLEGIARYLTTSREAGHFTYLLGRSSESGWPHYYLVALLVKNTPGFLIAMAAAVAWFVRVRVGGAASVAWHWILPVAVILIAASTQRIQVGERYILSVYPYLILLAASAVPGIIQLRWGRLVLAGVLLAHGIPSLVAAPGGYLSYFNLLAGGRRGAHRVLIDSNLDWGQDLPRLAAWMKANGVEDVQLGYFGRDDPNRYGIQHHDLPGSHFCAAGPAAHPLEGVVAVSPNLLFSRELALDVKYPSYEWLAARTPDDRGGVFFIYRLPPGRRRPIRDAEWIGAPQSLPVR